MFEKEIKFINDLTVSKLKGLGEFISLEQIKSAGIHPAVFKYIEAEIDYLIYEDRSKLLKNSIFDYSGKKIEEHFKQVAGEIKNSKKFSQDYISKLVLHAISFNLNYLTRPNWSIVRFLFDGSDEKNRADIQNILNYLYYYDYLKKIILSYLEKKNLNKFSKLQLEELLVKIDQVGNETNIFPIIDTAVKSISDFLNYHELKKTSISLNSVQQFLKDKNFLSILEIVNKKFEKTNLNVQVEPVELINEITREIEKRKVEEQLPEEIFEEIEEFETENDIEELEVFEPEPEPETEAELDSEVENNSETEVESEIKIKPEVEDQIEDVQEEVKEEEPEENISEETIEVSEEILPDPGETREDIDTQVEEIEEKQEEEILELEEVIDEIEEFEEEIIIENTDAADTQELTQEETTEDITEETVEQVEEVIPAPDETKEDVDTPVEATEEEQEEEIFESEKITDEIKEFEEGVIEENVDVSETSELVEEKPVGEKPEEENLIEETDPVIDIEPTEEEKTEEQKAEEDPFLELDLEAKALEKLNESIETSKLNLNVPIGNPVTKSDHDVLPEVKNDKPEYENEVFEEVVELDDNETKDFVIEEEYTEEKTFEEDKLGDAINSSLHNEETKTESEDKVNPEIDIADLLEHKKMTRIIEVIFDYDMEDFTNCIDKISECKNETQAATVLENLFRQNGVKPTKKEAELFKDIIFDYFKRK